jgi:hypothetical protein
MGPGERLLDDSARRTVCVNRAAEAFITPKYRRAGARRRLPCGIVLLEALIAILILALSTAGVLGLAARAWRDAGDAHWRSIASGLAESTLARMWTEDPLRLSARYDSALKGPGWRDLAAAAAVLPGVTSETNIPIVSVATGPRPGSTRVTVTLTWQAPGEAATHRHSLTSVVASR